MELVETSQRAWKHWMILFIISNSVVLEELEHETINRKCRRTANAVEIVWNRMWCRWWTDSSLHCHISAFENEAGSTANSYSNYLSTQGKDNSKESMQIVTNTEFFKRLNGKVKCTQKRKSISKTFSSLILKRTVCKAISSLAILHITI